MRLMLLGLLVAVSVASAGCATRMPVGIEYCQIASRYWYSDQAELDATPQPLVEWIEQNNTIYERLCKGK